jgi:hypothetical protein
MWLVIQAYPLAIGGGIQPHVRPSTESVITRKRIVYGSFRGIEKNWNIL